MFGVVGAPLNNKPLVCASLHCIKDLHFFSLVAEKNVDEI